MDKSSIPVRGARPSLSRIDEDSVWDRSINSSGSEELVSTSPEPEETPERAKQKIKSLKEVVNNVQLDYDTLKEYTVLERQVLNTEKLADLSLTQPDLLGSLFNRSLTMDQSGKSFVAQDLDSGECILSQSNAGDSSETMKTCPEELQTIINNLKLENEKLKTILEERETRLKALLTEESNCTETPAVAELQTQIEKLTQQNKEYKDNIDSLMQFKQNCEDKNSKVNDLYREIKRLQDENGRLQQELESRYQQDDSSEESSSEENFQVQQLLERQRNLQNQRDTLQNSEAVLRAELTALTPCKEQLEEQNAALQRFKEEFQLSDDSDILSSLREYIIGLNNKGDYAENTPHAAEYPDKTISLLKSEIEDLTRQLEDAKKSTVTQAAPKILTNGSDQSNSFNDQSLENLLAEINNYNSEIEGLKSNIRELEDLLETKDNTIATLENSISNKDGIIRQMECKTNVLTSYMSFLTKHIENVTNNNDILFMQVKEKSDRVTQLESHVQGVKNKLRKFSEQNKTLDLDASNFFYDLFETNVADNSFENNASSLSPSKPQNDNIANVIATPKSFIDFSMCLNHLFSTNSVNQSPSNMDSWLNETSCYFHQLFESVCHNDSVVDPVQEKSPTDDTNYFICNLFKTLTERAADVSLNETCVADQTLDTSNYWYALFDSFQSKINESQINDSQFNTSNMLGNLFKSRNNSVNKSLNESAKSCGNNKSIGQNDFSLLFRADASLNSTDAVNLSVFKNMNESQFSLSESLENQLLASCAATPKENSKTAGPHLLKSNAIHPEIAFCDATLNSSTMFNGNYTCSEDPLKSFCVDATLIEGSSGFLSDSLITEESEFDLYISPQSLLKKILNLKILLNEFENGVEKISGRKIDISCSTDPFISAFNVLMKSYGSAYDALKNLIHSFDLNDLVLDGFEISLRESSDPINLTLKYEAIEKKLYNLSVNLNDVTILMSNLEDQINLETDACKTLEEAINQRESELQELTNETVELEVSGASNDLPEVSGRITVLENELTDLKNTLQSKEQKIKELSNSLEELKVKDEKASEAQRRCQDLQTETHHNEGILQRFLEELEKSETETSVWEGKVSSLLKELNMTNMLRNHSFKFEEIAEQFASIQIDTASATLKTLQNIQVLLVSLLDRKANAEETLLDLLREVGELKSVQESKETTLTNQMQKQEARIKELMELNLEKMRNKTQDLDLELSFKEESIQHLLDQIGGFNEDKEYYETEMIKFMKQIDSLTADLEDKDNEMSFLKEDWRIMLEGTKETLKQNMLEIIIAEKVSQESRISELVSQLATLQLEKEKHLLRLQLLDQREADLAANEELLTKEKAVSEELRMQVEQLENDLERRSEELSKVLDELISLKSELECTDAKIKDLQLEVDSFKSVKQAMTELLEDNSSYQQKNAELVEQLETMSKIKDETQMRIEDLTEKLKISEINEAEIKRKIADLEAQCDILEKLGVEKEVQITAHVEKLRLSEASVLESKKRIDGLDVELNILKESKSLCERQIADLENELVLLKEKEEKSDFEVSDLIKEITALKLKESQFKKQSSELIEKLEISRANEADNMQKVKNLEEDLRTSKENEAETKIQVSQLESELNTLKGNEVERKQRIADLEQEVSALKMNEEQIKQENVDLVDELKVLKENEVKSKQQISEVESELSTLKVNDDEMKERIADLEQEVSSLKMNEEQIKQENVDLVEELKVLRENQVKSKQQISELESELTTLRGNEAERKERIADLEQEVSSLKMKEEQIMKEKVCLVDDLKALRQNEVENKQQISELDEELRVLKLKEAEKTSTVAHLESELTALKVDEAKSKQEIATLIEVLNNTKSAAQNESGLADLVAELNALKEKNEIVNVTRLQQVERTQARLVEVEKQLNEKASVAAELESKLRSIEGDKKQFEDKLNRMMEETDKLREESKTLAKLADDNNAKEQCIKELMSQLEKVRNDALEVEDLCLKLSKIESELEKKQKALDSIQKKYEACKTEKSRLEDQMKALQDESATLAAVEKDLAKMTEDNAAKDKVIEGLLSKLSNFEAEKTQNVHVPEVVEQTQLKLVKTELELKEKEQRVSELEEDKKYFEEQMIAMMEEVDDLKDQLECSKQQGRGKSIGDSIEGAQIGEEEKSSEHPSALQRRLNDEEELVAQLKDKLSKMDTEKCEKENEISMLLEKLDNYQAKVEIQLNEIDRLKKVTSDLERLVKQDGSPTMTVLNEEKRVEETPVTQVDEINRLLKEISALSDANTKLKVEKAVLVEEKSDVVKNLEETITKKTEELSLVLSEAEASKQHLTQLEAEIEKLKFEQEKPLATMDLKSELQDRERELQEMVNEKSAEIVILTSKLSCLNQNTEDSAELKREVDCLTHKVETLEAVCSAKTEEISRLQEELNSKSEEANSLERQLVEMKEKLGELETAENQLEKLKIEVTTSEQMVEVFKNRMHALEEEVQVKKTEGETWTQKFALLHEEIDSKVMEIDRLKEKIQQLNQSASNLECNQHQLESAPSIISDELKEATAAKLKLIQEIHALKPEFKAEKIPFTGLISELMSTIMEKQKEVFIQLISESETLKKEIEFFKSKESNVKKWMDELEQENTKLQSALNQKKEEISAACEKLSTLNKKLDNESDVIATLQSQLESKDEDIAALKLQVAKLQDSTASQQTAAELKLQDGEISKLNSECDALRSKLLKEEDTISSLRGMIDERSIKFTELNDEYVKLKGELAEVQGANESLNTIIICKDDEIGVLKEKLEQSIRNIREADEVNEKYNRMIQSNDSLTADLATLQRTVKEKLEQNSTLQSQLMKKEEYVSHLMKEMEEKASQIASLTSVVEEKKSVIEQLEASLREEQSKIASQTDTTADSEKIISLNAEVKSLKNSLNKHMLDHEASKIETNKLKQQVKTLLEEIKLMESKLQIEKNRTAIQVSEVKMLEEEKKKMLENLQQLQAEKATLADRLDKLQASFETSLCSPSSDAKKADPTSTPIMFKRGKQNEKLSRKNAVLEKKVESLIEKEVKLMEVEEFLRSLLPSQSPSPLSSMMSLVKQRLKDADENIVRLSRELVVKDRQVEELTKMLDHNKEKVEALTAALTESEEKRKTLDEECVLTWQQCVSLEKDYAEALRRENVLKQKLHESTTISESMLAEDDKAKLRDEKNALMKENNELVGQLRILKNEKRQMVSDFYKARVKVKEAEAELIKMQSQVEMLEKEKQSLDTKNSSLTSRLIQVTDEKENLSTNLNVLICKYDKLETTKNTATDDQLSNLKSQMQKLRTELADKTAKITMLELQIQSENFPYRGKVLELEANVASYKKKCEDLRSQLRRYQAERQESTVQECAQCVSRRSKAKSEIGVQTMATLQLDGGMSSIVQNNAEAVIKDRVKKLEREHETMKRLCRMRASKITSLEQYIKQHNLPVPDSKENTDSASSRSGSVKSTEKESSFSSRLWPF